ncbi:chromophore lyase CpcT/CpeT [Pontimicrobium sp. IMCC45349]|uniref:chromophore lyase CpcT/CpeT n=1 Tax=Pontimicrobium sp. IMCC45349 TaxID=3391574 RepID=UPI0039A17663
MRITLLLLTVICLSSCKNESKEIKAKEDIELKELYGLMQGSFNSEAQSVADSTYFNISLHMYPIWEDKGNYLYVEQALNSMQDRPYRQRVYEVKRLSDSTFGSYIYKIPNDSLWIGKWKTPADFNKLTVTDLELRNGCEVVLKRIGDKHYKGKTGNKTCESTMRGAAYATSEVEIMPSKIISWDRGFNSADEHVWGAEKAGYIFDEIKK